jgi:hypothetical protein
MSPARAHRERTAAEHRAAAGAPEQHVNANAYELMLMKLAEDRRSLKSIQSMEKRAEYKRRVLPEYAAWIDGALSNEHGVQDDVLTTVMVWRIDAGDLPGALDIGRYVIKHRLVMPDQYKRSAACLLAEEIADVALRDLAEDVSPEAGRAMAETLQGVAELTADQDMPDEVRAKLHKALGYAMRDSDKPVALGWLRRAFGLHDKVGVKRDIELLERDIKNTPPAAGDTTGSAG